MKILRLNRTYTRCLVRRCISASILAFVLGGAVQSLLAAPQVRAPTPANRPTATASTVIPAANVLRDLVIQNTPLIVRSEAFLGEPYGFGKVTFRLREGDDLIERSSAVLLTDRENRIFYPMISRSSFKTFIETFRGTSGRRPDDAQTVWFFFTGDQPLQLTLQGSGGIDFEVPVEVARPRQFTRMAKQWWQTFNAVIDAQIKASDYPSLVETYLLSMMARRMDLPLDTKVPRNPDPLMQTFELMFDVESLRTDTIRDSMLYGIRVEPSDRPLPAPIAWSPVMVENLPDDIEIEPLAKCVPEECFYLRFGTWQNQIWLQRLMEEFGGNLSRMIQVRGVKYKIQSKFLNQLAIQSTEFDQLFGGSLIDDVAVIGMDTYFDNGSAVGVMLHARDTKRLGGNLSSKRRKFADSTAGATIRTLDFKQDTIEFLSTPDNRYRSFYAVSGDCHLITTSLTIAQRFLEAGQGQGALADSPEYRFARLNMPLDRDDTIFVYLSTKFFQQLLTPQYQIELRRRNRLVTDIVLLEMARLAAANELYEDQSISGLIRGKFLPEGFGYRPDGGQLVVEKDYWVDSIRGRRGFFAPIPDLPLQAVTADEVAWFEKRASFFAQAIQSLDPMLVAIKRYDRGENIERVVFDARVAPFGGEKYGWLMSMLGPPLRERVARNEGDIIRLEASLQGGKYSPNVPLHQVFAAVQDYLDPSLDLRPSSVIGTFQMLRETPGYLGAFPNPGYLDWMPALGGEPDPLGYTYSRMLKLWRLQWQGFALLAFDQQRLESLKPQLRFEPTERPSQVRLVVGDLAKSKISAWANSVNYRRSWQTSVANVQLLNLLTQQFRVSPEAARASIERMLDVELVCSLDGEYELATLPTGRKLWYSNAWPSFLSPELPPGHLAPLLKWFRGVEIEVMKSDSQFSVHGFLDIERTETDANPLPSFDLFKGFGNLFGGAGNSSKQ